MKRMSGHREVVPFKIRLSIARAVSMSYSMIPDCPGRLRQQVEIAGWKNTTALRRLSSSKTDAKSRIAGPLIDVVRPQSDAVGFQRVKGIFDFFQAPVLVGKRQRREHSEAAREIRYELRVVFVALASEAARPFAFVAHRIHHQALDRGQHCGGDTCFIHHLDGGLRGPGWRVKAGLRHVVCHGLYVGRRIQVMVHVDTAES